MKSYANFFAVCGIGMMASSQLALADTITVVNNGGVAGEAFRNVYYASWSELTGHEVIDDTFSQELARIRSQIETGNLQWDVVSVTAINEATGCEEGLLERIDWSLYLDPADFADVGGFGECGVPNNFVSGGLAYDGDVYADGDAPQNWQDFWDVERFPGMRGLLYRAEQTLEVALMADGVPPAEVMEVLAAPGGVDRAFAKLEELKPHIRWWRSGDESMQNLLSGDVVMTFAWNGRVASANNSNNRNLRIEFGGGHVSGNQMIAVMRGTPRLDLAIDFIRHTSSPEQQAGYARYVSYAPANRRGYEFMTPEELATLPSGHMDMASLQSGSLYLNFWLDNGDALLQRFVTMAAQ